MDKNIVVRMTEDKDIIICRNGEEVLKILEGKRSVRASEIYEALDYSKGDTYSVSSDNPKSVDDSALSFIYDLFSDICEKLNSLSSEDEENQLANHFEEGSEEEISEAIQAQDIDSMKSLD